MMRVAQRHFERAQLHCHAAAVKVGVLAVEAICGAWNPGMTGTGLTASAGSVNSPVKVNASTGMPCVKSVNPCPARSQQHMLGAVDMNRSKPIPDCQ